MSEKMYSRWHRYTIDGIKIIKKFYVDEIPDPIIEPGYTEWRRGTGRLNEQQYKNVVNAVRRSCVGVPKSEDTKYKMRIAKLGVNKTPEHRANMSLAWQRKRLERQQNNNTFKL